MYDGWYPGSAIIAHREPTSCGHKVLGRAEAVPNDECVRQVLATVTCLAACSTPVAPSLASADPFASRHRHDTQFPREPSKVTEQPVSQKHLPHMAHHHHFGWNPPTPQVCCILHVLRQESRCLPNVRQPDPMYEDAQAPRQQYPLLCRRLAPLFLTRNRRATSTRWVMRSGTTTRSTARLRS